MRRIILIFLALLAAAPALAADNRAQSVVVTPVARTTHTLSGQKIVLPRLSPEVVVSTYEIPPGAALAEHKHPFPRYAYVLAGTLRVTNSETGKAREFKSGDFIVESIDQWHRGATIGDETVKLLVIDQVEQGEDNVVLKP